MSTQFDAPLPPLGDDAVMTLQEFDRVIRLSSAARKRMFAKGLGPRTVRLGLRKLGIRVADYRAWLEQRATSSEVA
jgi:predicted DNA-binding transcriptional regulator AlpA